jgi:hypothetical protein
MPSGGQLCLTERGVRVVAGQPLSRLKARTLQLATQALHRGAVAGLPGQFPQTLALRRIEQDRRAAAIASSVTPAECGRNRPIDHGLSSLARGFRAWCCLQQLLQRLLVGRCT